MEVVPHANPNPIPRAGIYEDELRRQREEDEEYAFQEILKQIGQAEAKAFIAERDESLALEMQDKESGGKNLYSKYPNLDLIKGDAFFFPLKEALDKPEPKTQSKAVTSVQAQPRAPVQSPNQTLSSVPAQLKTALADAGIGIRAAPKPGSESIYSSPSHTVPASEDVSTSSPREGEEKPGILTRLVNALHISSPVASSSSSLPRAEAVPLLQNPSINSTPSSSPAPQPRPSYADALSRSAATAKVFVPTNLHPKAE